MLRNGAREYEEIMVSLGLMIELMSRCRRSSRAFGPLLDIGSAAKFKEERLLVVS